MLSAIFYVLSTGCQWKARSKDQPPKSTAHFYFMLWEWDGTFDRIHDALYTATREACLLRGLRLALQSSHQRNKADKIGGNSAVHLSKL